MKNQEEFIEISDKLNNLRNQITKIESSEEEYDKSKDDVTGILQILNMLTQNINVSVESIKANIQQSNAEAIEHSAEDFKKFVRNPQFICKKCGRAAAKAENLCQPDTL